MEIRPCQTNTDTPPLRWLAALLCVGLMTGGWAQQPRWRTTQGDTAGAESRVREVWTSAALGSFTIATTYYVSSADGNCTYDGLAATFVSGTNGPWADLNCLAARQALNAGATNGRIVYLRQGTYNLMDGFATYGENGLALIGGGTATSPLVLAGYPGDARPVITGNECYTNAQVNEIATSGTLDGQPYTLKVRQVLNISGSYVLVTGLELRCGFRHLIQYGGAHLAARDLQQDTAYEDLNKVLSTASYVTIDGVDMANIASQGVDWFGADHGLITNSAFHGTIPDPTTQVNLAVAVGMKGGAADVVVTRNRIYNLASDGTHAAVSIGGAPSALDQSGVPSADEIYVGANTIDGFYGMACQFAGGVDSYFNDNLVTNTLGLCRVGTDPDVRAGDPLYADQPLTSGARLKRNRIVYAPVDCTAPLTSKTCYGLYVANTAEAVGLLGVSNVYASPGFVSPSFVWGIPGGSVTFTQFKTSSSTETTSIIAE